MKVRFGASFPSINQYFEAKIPTVAKVDPRMAATAASKINGNRIDMLLAPTDRIMDVSRLRAKAATRTVFMTSSTVTNNIASAIASENSAALERIPGLGKKGAQRTVLELKDKVSDLARSQSSGSNSKSHWRTQLQSALIGLGFTARDAESTIDSVASDLGAKIDETDISELLKLALQSRGRG